ncbi:insulin-degrading enzyme isoform X1 [Pieris brassicae]|uniref:insulin-degrading enzyme isoform X1 n=1 Tax=Pieris brassicae TaxID=7116 RepID=UPI001E660B9C|nr:insulin-degrading enzyme isoform X1 [Pieris brassicae]
MVAQVCVMNWKGWQTSRAQHNMPEAALGRAPGTPATPPSSGGSALPATGVDRVLRRYEKIIKSPEDKRVYRGLQLGNGMKVLLVSDPETEKAAAALDVNVGYLSDPEELPGLAHFCEHMLFLGTEKYPQENEYSKFLSEHGGSSNASTAADHTTFYFDVLPSHLGATLDIFAQFFIAPLFTESATGRELSAVDSEHEKNRASDGWRLEQLNKSTADPGHPYHKFGTGNRETLETIPRRKGVDVRAELLAFHARWYSADIMALVVVGRESTDELEALVSELFGSVKAGGASPPRWDESPFPRECLRKRAYCEPVKDLRSLSVDFPLPDFRRHYKSGPSQYLSHLLGHEGPGSLLAALKARGWCNSLVGGSRLGARGFGFFSVQVDLTEEGVEHTDDVVTLLFEYLAMLREVGEQRWVWDEQRELSALEFRFRDALEPRTLAHAHAHQLQEYPTEEVLSAQYLLSEWRPDLIRETLELLTPDRVRLAVVAKRFADRCVLTEPWYGTKYLQEDIDDETLQKWRTARGGAELHLPPPNEFIPRRLTMIEDDDPTAGQAAPLIVKDTPLMRVWYKRDDEFRLPKAFITLEFASPLLYSSPTAAGLAALWAALLRDALQQELYAAELASLRWGVANAKRSINVTAAGFDDRLAALARRVAEALLSFRVDPRRFEILKEAHLRALANFDAEQPYQHAVYAQALCLSAEVWTRRDLLEAAQRLTPEMLDDFVSRVRRSLHLEALVMGNVSRSTALELAAHLEATFPVDAVPLLAAQLTPSREVELDAGSWYLCSRPHSVHRSSCAAVYLWCGGRSSRANVTLELLAHVVGEPCFHALRTREQLGYIVFSGVRRSAGAQGLRVIVQGDRHPAHLDSRIVAFLDSAREYLEKMSEEEFLKHRSSLAAERLERPKRLSDKAGRVWGEITSQMYNFERARVEVDELNAVTKRELLDFYSRHVHSSSPEARKLSVHVVSVAEGGAGHADAGNADAEGEDASRASEDERRRPALITDLVEFKSRRGLGPLPAPHAPVPRKGAHSKL